MVTIPDGTIEVLENDITYQPSSGYISIQDFMVEQLNAYEALTRDISKL